MQKLKEFNKKNTILSIVKVIEQRFCCVADNLITNNPDLTKAITSNTGYRARAIVKGSYNYWDFRRNARGVPSLTYVMDLFLVGKRIRSGNQSLDLGRALNLLNDEYSYVIDQAVAGYHFNDMDRSYRNDYTMELWNMGVRLREKYCKGGS